MSDQSTGGTTASSLMSEARDAASGAFEEARSRASDVASRTVTAARAEAMSRAEGAKEGLAEQGVRLADQLRQAASGDDASIQARVMGAAADSIEDFASSLRGRSLDELVSEATGFARRNPGAFVVAAALAGFAVARFARASAPHSQSYAGIEGDGAGASYGSPRHTGTGYAGAASSRRDQAGYGQAGYGSDSFGSGGFGSTASGGFGAGRPQGVVSTSGLSTHDDDDEAALGGDADRGAFGQGGSQSGSLT